MFIAPWDAATIAVKAAGYAATLAAAGAVFFLVYCRDLITHAERARVGTLVKRLAVLSVLAGGAQILVTAGSMSGEAAGMLNGPLVLMAWDGGQGLALTIRAVGLMVAVFCLQPERLPWAGCVGAAMGTLSFAVVGHVRALHPDLLPILLVCAHLLGIAFWLGALAPLLIVTDSPDVPRAAAAAARFGGRAIFVVAGLTTAGLVLLWIMLGDFAALWTSAYGRHAVVKLAFVACLLCLAAFNKFRLTPRLLAGNAPAVRHLRTSLKLEILAGALILASTAALTTIDGPPALG